LRHRVRSGWVRRYCAELVILAWVCLVTGIAR
jgi:hypothetical protein